MDMDTNRQIYNSVVQENANKVRFLKAFGEGTRFGIMYITFEDEAYGVGYNGDFNLLGVAGNNFLRKRLENPEKISRLCGKGIQHVCLADHVAVGLGSRGELYQWGLPYSQIRSCYDRNSIQLPHLMTSCNHVVTKLDCGGGFFAVTTKYKKVFMWGYIDWSAPFSDGRLFSPMHKEVVDMACGTWHMIMLTADGKPYSCGHGGYGQLGYDWSESCGYWRIQKILFNEPCVKVAAGSSSSLVITASGELYAFGLNHHQFGFLGVDSEEPAIKKPVRVRLDVPVSDVAASYALATLRNVYAAISQDGTAYKWGWGSESRWPLQVSNVTNLRDMFQGLPTPPLYCLPHPIAKPRDESSSQPNCPLYSQCSTESKSSDCENETGSDGSSTAEDKKSNPDETKADFVPDEHRKLTLNNFNLSRDSRKNHLRPKKNNFLAQPTTNRFHSKFEVVCEHSAYKSYLDYVYSGGNMQLTFTQLLDVYILATHYEESQLIQHTMDRIKSQVSMSNFSLLLERSQIYKSAEMKSLCQNFIRDLCKDPHKVAELVTSLKICNA